ncbi:hypothetical protein [Agrobacterium arsenijevicii]|uniref:hypothetical protein n=1 Tax=Agrobacterium arsenijevicii TaxID=1585697 RepID=UPI000A44CB27
MKAVDSAKGRVSCQRLVVAVSLLGLAGCVSAVTDDDMAANAKKPAISAEQKVQAASAVNNPAAKQQQGHYVDPAVASATGGAVPVQSHTPGGPAQAYGAAADIGGLSTQPTAISAGTSSIYSTRPAVAAGAAATTGPASIPPGLPLRRVLLLQPARHRRGSFPPSAVFIRHQHRRPSRSRYPHQYRSWCRCRRNSTAKTGRWFPCPCRSTHRNRRLPLPRNLPETLNVQARGRKVKARA